MTAKQQYIPTVPGYKSGNRKPDSTPYPLTPEEVTALNNAAKKLNVEAEWIYKMILWESLWYSTIGVYKTNGDLTTRTPQNARAATKTTKKTNGNFQAVGLNQINNAGLSALKKNNPSKYGKFKTQQELIIAYPTRLLQLQNTVPDFFEEVIKTFGHPKSFEMFYVLNFTPAYFKHGPDYVLPAKIQKANGGVKTSRELAGRANARAIQYPYSLNANGGSVNTVTPEVKEAKKSENKPKAAPKPKPAPKPKKAPSVPKVTHHTGKYNAAVKAVVSKASGDKGVGGVFYSIFTQNGFYDVADLNNGLTVEQRAQVPAVNQRRFSQMSNAIAEMFQFVLGDAQFGVLTKTAQSIADSLDIRSTANAAQINTIGAGFAAVAAVPIIGQYLASIDSARKFTEQATVTSMGGTMADPSFVPPTFSGTLPVISPIGNLLTKGFVKPDINFIYEYEPTKNSKVYEFGKNYAIGTQIILYDGSSNYQVVLKQIFGVAGVDSNLNAIGTPVYGVSSDTYDTLVSIANKEVGTLDATLNAKKDSISLTNDQMRASFFQWYMYRFWNVLTDSGTTLYAHWGCLTNNNLPGNIRTAISSYVWSTKSFTLTPGENNVAAYISYFVQMGLYYLIGYPNPVKITGLGYVIKINTSANAPYIDENNKLSYAPAGATIIAVNGVPKNQEIANRYFRWAAYTISLATTSDPRLEASFRKQRMAEAALILKNISKLSTDALTYGDLFAVEIPIEMGRDNYDNAIVDPIYRYNNTASAGTTGKLNPNTSQVTVTYQSQVQKTDSNGWVLPGTIDKLKQIAKLSGVTEVSISNTVQSANELAEDLFNLEESGTQLQYAAPAQRVVDSYRYAKTKNELLLFGVTTGQVISAGLTKAYKVNEKVSKVDKIALIDIMLNQIKVEGAYAVSKHAAESQSQYHIRQVIDVSNTSSKPVSAMPQFKSRLKEIVKDQSNPYNLSVYTEATPKNEANNHLEFSNIDGGGGAPNNLLPDVVFNGITSSNYIGDGRQAVFIADMNRVKSAAR